jgi:hypothetical protein
VEGGANIFGVFRVKNHDFTPIYFFNFRGGARRVRAGCVPWIHPWIWLQSRSSAAYLSSICVAVELCPENYCTWHRPYNNVRVVKCNIHALVMLEYSYWWKLTIGKATQTSLRFLNTSYTTGVTRGIATAYPSNFYFSVLFCVLLFVFCLRPLSLSCVPYITSVSGLSILDCHFGVL